MSIYETIKKDHDEHRRLMDELAETSGDSTARRALWTKFYYDVKAHGAAEEEAFYSKLIATEAGQPDARHSVHEHQEIDDLLEELQGMDMSSPGWLTRFKKLKHDYEHHMDEEEADIFERAREEIGADADNRIGGTFQQRKKAEIELVDQKAEDALEE